MILQFNLKYWGDIIIAAIGTSVCVLLNIKLIVWATEVWGNVKCCFNEDRHEHLLVPCIEFKSYAYLIYHYSGARECCHNYGPVSISITNPYITAENITPGWSLVERLSASTEEAFKINFAASPIKNKIIKKKRKCCSCLPSAVLGSCSMGKKISESKYWYLFSGIRMLHIQNVRIVNQKLLFNQKEQVARAGEVHQPAAAQSCLHLQPDCWDSLWPSSQTAELQWSYSLGFYQHKLV